ncbi:helix-turn-helix domain-containing protein [Microlunatus sp. Y2014]|uniref:helix-turn-helix domain-containing protein n=1 Tax=Microlunatus sp. Y2014 TaxID=3418488 RepID=UPI003DA716E1
MTSDADPPRLQSLGRGLQALSLLVHADRALSASEVGRRLGVHQTTASRILADLVTLGYAHRVGPHAFGPDFGLLALGLESSKHFALLARPRAAMEWAGRRCPGLTVSLCLWWRDELLYFDQTVDGLDTQLFSGRGYPMHLSSPGLLFLLQLPEAAAMSALATSRERFGWARPTPAVPASEADLLAAARRRLQLDTLVLPDWQNEGHTTGAVVLGAYRGHSLALTLAGPGDVMTTGSLRRRLHEIRGPVADTLVDLTRPVAPPTPYRGLRMVGRRRQRQAKQG